MTDKPVAFYHRDRQHIAFYYDHHPQAGEELLPQHFQALDGTQPRPGDPLHCGTCGEPLRMDQLEVRGAEQ